ncbi:MAG: HAD family phosphatase [Treponema sp.]|jgi:beta-phosphoglucomutase-like phosphatase (HAD superfamily)|nr:HAD family phosphatase [Treponema sp.]
MKAYKAYIFDLDGTLLDSMGVWNQIDVDFLGKRGIAVPPDYMNAISSMTFHETAAYTIKRFALSDSIDGLMREWNDMAAYAYSHTVQMKPYAKEYLMTLKERGLKLAVATSLSAELCDPVLRNNGIDTMFDVICNTDEAGHGKSRPDVFLLAAQRTGVPVGGCLVFEDILAAVKSAKSAGMSVCAVYDKTSANDWEEIKKTADYAIDDFRSAPLPPG